MSRQAEASNPVLIQGLGITRSFGRGDARVSALQGVNLTINKGRLVALQGRSGSGKTTLMNILAGLDRPDSGEVYLGDRRLDLLGERERTQVRKRQIGLIFQSFALISLMSAYENVEFALRISDMPRKEQQALAAQALEKVGLSERAAHRPSELSGGEQQRVAIARAIAHRPPLILADEPTAELDTRTGLQIMQVFRQLVAQDGVTVLMTTHDPAIMEIVDEVYELEDGKIVEQN